MRKLFILLPGLLFPLFSFSQPISANQGNIQPQEYFQVIPYKNINDKIIIPVTIDGRLYHFVLDTGAPFAISQKIFNTIETDSVGMVDLSDANQQSQQTRVVSVPKLSIGSLTFLNSVGIVLNDKSEKMLACWGIDGIIGSNLLRHSVVQFNSKDKIITLTDNAKKLNLRRKYAQKMVLSPIQSNPFIYIHFKKGKRKGREELLFDSGGDNFYDMSIRSYRYFTKQTNVFDKLAEGTGSYSWGMNGTAGKQRQYLLNIPNLKINKTDFKNVVANTTTDSQSRIGAPLLHYGTVTLDYAKKRFYFKPFDTINTRSLSQHPWSIEPTLKNGKLVVGIIWQPSLRKEIHTGDPIIKYCGTDFSKLNPCQIVNFATADHKQQDDGIIVVKDAQTGQIKTIQLKRM